MNPPKPITFYDIGSGPSSKPFAPNPWKTRYALNFSSIPFTTTFVPLPDVGRTRASLNLPPVRKHLDGSDFPTLPIIHDHTQPDAPLVGDSFDIALHLHTHYPSHPHPLFPPHTVALHRAFNAHADALFAAHGVPLAGYWLPLDPATAEQSRAEMLARFGLGSWEELKVEGAAREEKMKAFEEALGGLAAWFVKRGEGPFLEGATPMYADLVVGAWLMWLRLLLPEWEVVRGWHGGVWGRLADALEVWAGGE